MNLNPYEPLSRRTRWSLHPVGWLLVLSVWSLLCLLGDIPERKLPPPWAVLEQLAYLTYSTDTGVSLLGPAILASLARIVIASALVFMVGLPVGVMLGASPRLDAAFGPVVNPFRSAPVVAVLPILIGWTGPSELTRVSFLWIGAVVFFVPMVRDAIRAVPMDHYIQAVDIGATPVETVWHTLLPLAKPRIARALVTAVSVEWTYITVAEMVNTNSGLGKLISDSSRTSAMDQVFAEIGTIIALALVTHLTLTSIVNRLYPKGDAT